MAVRDIREFDYRKVAELDAKMWRAYYNHQFIWLFVLLLRITRTQLGLNWYQTFRLAYYSGRAATDYRLRKRKENYKKILNRLINYYKIISDHSTKPFDYRKAAELELEWWDIHRYPTKYKKLLEQSLADNMAVVYKISPAKLKIYAHYRAMAMKLPNHKGDKQENPPDWVKIEMLLTKSWRSLYNVVQK